MSLDQQSTAGVTPPESHVSEVADAETDTFPQPRAHGAAIQSVLNDLAPSDREKRGTDRGTLYDHTVAYWREHVQDHTREPYVAVEDFDADWLPEDGQFALVVKSSKWKAGTGRGDDYRAMYEQHVMLRRVVETNSGTELKKPPLALHVEVEPQFRDLVYKDGNPLECPHGEGTRLEIWTTWAEDPEAAEERAYDALRAVYGDVLDPETDRNPNSRRIAKAEAHVRFAHEKMGNVVETLDQSRKLVAYGGESEISAHQRRQREGYLEALVESDRWDLLGFPDQPFASELKVYRRKDWHTLSPENSGYHPKLEASFAGVQRGELPHVTEWDAVLDHLRALCATHAKWAGVERSDLVADDFFDGPLAADYRFQRPTGRREMLRSRYEEVATEVYREALKPNTTAIYDVLKVVSEHNGATYDHLVEETGLARSTVRYHIARLESSGVFVKVEENPVLVAYAAPLAREEAADVLAEVYPDDNPEDRKDRAQRRREDRRERQERRDPNLDTVPSDVDDSSTAGREDSDATRRSTVDDSSTERSCSEDADDSLGFRYLAHVEASAHDLAFLRDREELADRDIRVRADELPEDLR